MQTARTTTIKQALEPPTSVSPSRAVCLDLRLCSGSATNSSCDPMPTCYLAWIYQKTAGMGVDDPQQQDSTVLGAPETLQLQGSKLDLWSQKGKY